MTQEQQALLDGLFTRYGAPSKEAERQIRFYGTRPDTINELERVASNDRSATEAIKSALHLIEELTAYRVALAERYAYLSTAPTVPFVRLLREKRYYQNKVFYHLIVGRRNLDTGAETETERTTYPGVLRSQALKDFAAYVKAHPGIIAEKDIEKSKWE